MPADSTRRPALATTPTQFLNPTGLAARGLRQAGYQVEKLDGGMKAWTGARLPLDPPGGRVH
jgi:hypothetical protein